VVRELQAEGLSDLWATMINNPLARGQGGKLDELNARIPALQDTFTTIYGGYTPHVGALLGCLSGEELLVVDSTRRLHIKLTAGPGGFDLREGQPRETLKGVIRETTTWCGCADSRAQLAALDALRAECAAAGVAPLRILAIEPAAAGCLLPPGGATSPVLKDAAPGLFDALDLRGGELLLLDGDSRIRRRALAGGCVDHDLDLTQAGDRARVVQWLQAVASARPER
jgi:hypothetical protein